MADAAAKLAPTVDARAAIDAVPRNYNFAADIIERNLKAGRANKPVYIDPRGRWTYADLLSHCEALAGRLLGGRADLDEARVALLCAPGHDFTVVLSDAERKALIEYLKTL